MTQLDSIVAQQLEFYANKAGECTGKEQQFWVQQGVDLLSEYDSEEEGVGTFWATYWRYESESFGVTCEIEHGDPELMFGGVLDNDWAQKERVMASSL